MPAVRTSAHVLFVNASGQVLLRQRDDRAGLPHPNQWDLLGGAVEGDESLEEAAIREVNEEIGLYVTELEHLGEYPGEPVNDIVNNVFLSFVPVRLEATTLTEGQRLRYVSAEEARTLDLVPWVAAMLEDFFGDGTDEPPLE